MVGSLAARDEASGRTQRLTRRVYLPLLSGGPGGARLVVGVLVSERLGYTFGGEEEGAALRALAARVAAAAHRCALSAGRLGAPSAAGVMAVAVAVRGERPGGERAGSGAGPAAGGAGVSPRVRVLDAPEPGGAGRM